MPRNSKGQITININNCFSILLPGFFGLYKILFIAIYYFLGMSLSAIKIYLILYFNIYQEIIFKRNVFVKNAPINAQYINVIVVSKCAKKMNVNSQISICQQQIYQNSIGEKLIGKQLIVKKQISCVVLIDIYNFKHP